MAKIKICSTPETLYRYRAITDETIERELKAIEDGFIYCPPSLNMNDPMEGMHDENRFMRALKTYDETIKEVKEYLEKSGLASLSETHFSEPMWAYYAGNFAGICIEYHLGHLAYLLPNDVAIVRVHYSEAPPMFRANQNTAEDRARVALSCKTLRWQSEREWRIMNPAVGEARYKDPHKVVISVFVGSRMPDSKACIVAERMHRQNIPVQMMRIDKYTVQFEKVEKLSADPETGAAPSDFVQASMIERVRQARGGSVPDEKPVA